MKAAVKKGFKPFVMEVTFETEQEVDAFNTVLNHNKTVWESLSTKNNISDKMMEKVWDNISAKMYTALQSMPNY